MKRIITAGLALAVGLSPTLTHASNYSTLPTLRSRVAKHKQTKQKPLTNVVSRGASLLDIQWISCTLTWYSSQQGVGDGLTTATGTRVHNHSTVAVDPKVIPLGSTIEIRFTDGTTQVFHAEDTGGAIKGRHIDIYNNDNKYCINKGVQVGWYRIIY